ncbi:MAG: hypothetical protein IPK07_00340 [Deltaproteobacteria bacterium]|nr:hypothetical protein [Deltaproteobacteria bacterium]
MDRGHPSRRAVGLRVASVAIAALALARPSPAADRPELVAEVLPVDSPSAPTAQKVPLEVAVENTGTADAPETWVRFFRSTDRNIGPGDTLVALERLRPVAAGGLRWVTGQVKVGTTPGTSFFGACVVAVPDEIDPDHNCTDGTPIEVGKRPNLTVSDFVVTPTSLRPGEPMRFTALLRNSGTGAAGLAFVSVFRSSSPTGPPDSWVANADTASLAPGESFDVSFEVDERFGSGASWYGLCADTVLFETSTDDNCTPGVQVTVEGPDLAALAPSVDHAQVALGDSVTFTVEVRNLGTEASTPRDLDFEYQDPTSGRSFGSVTVPALPPGGAQTFSMPKSADTPGVTELWACVERIDDELDRNDCSTSVSFLVSGVELDPDQGWIHLGERNYVPGSGFTAGTVIMMYVAGPSGATPYGPFAPESIQADYLYFSPPLSVPLGNGFASLVAINTDQGYAKSSPACVNLVGPDFGNPPSIWAIDGVSLAEPDCAVPFAYIRATLTPGQPVEVSGAGFDQPRASLFTSVGSLGPLDPAFGWREYAATFTTPANAPVGPASVQVVSAPYSGIASSNAVLVAVGEPIAIDGVTVNGATITVSGHGFSTGAVINLFNAQGGTVVNLGGLDSGGAPLVPLTSVTPTSFQFQRPAGAVAGKAFVEVLNPPFIPVTSTGNDPDGAFDLP